MKIPKMAKSMEYIDNDLVSEAASYKRSNIILFINKWGAIAACFAIMLVASVFIYPYIGGDIIGSSTDGPSSSSTDRYKDFNVLTMDHTIDWWWDNLVIYENYSNITVGDTEYGSSKREISYEYVGEKIGVFTASGYNYTGSGKPTMDFEVYKIKDVSDKKMVAVKMEESYYIYKSKPFDQPLTLGALLGDFDFDSSVKLSSLALIENEKRSYGVIENDAYIWEMIRSCKDATLKGTQNWSKDGKDYVDFTVSSEKLGLYKSVLTITKDGYLFTNGTNFGRYALYFIGEDTANKIIDYVRSNLKDGKYEPEAPTLVGTLTQITEEYIIIDDSIICNDTKNGIQYKILLNDKRISRYIENNHVHLNETVFLVFEGEIDTENGYVIDSAVSISGALISSDGEVMVPEY
ncbi:MAG: hypothetical protein IJF26_00415 [Clostridia bacterium]|nr:hypothetical protein [Clostridia bacterium]